MRDQLGLQLRAILDNPTDDAARIVYADLLEERNQLGDAERADFIRLQISKGDLYYNLQYRIDKHNWQLLVGRCKWANDMILAYKERTGSYPGYSWGSSESPTGPGLYKCGAEEITVDYHVFKMWIRRGFVAKVSCTLEDWCGDRCPECGGDGIKLGSWSSMELRQFRPPIGTATDCPTCHGTGRTSGHGPGIVRCQPIEQVKTNREPVKIGEVWNWMAGSKENPEPESPHFIGPALYALLDLPLAMVGNEVMNAKCALSLDAAHAALSDALIAWAKSTKE